MECVQLRTMKNQLPPPSADALASSDALAARIADDIAASGGWISFARFMELALYAPGLGYYSGGAHKFGPAGDFITAPEISPLFGQAMARQVFEIMSQSADHVLEVGAGTGTLAGDLLKALEAAGRVPERYDILEVSGELRVRQEERLRAAVPHLIDRVRWLDAMPEAFSGCVVANEVLDVIPVQIVVWRDAQIFERGVVHGAEGFDWEDRPATGRLLEVAGQLGVALEEGGEYVTEICLAARAWVGEWGRRIEKGAMILVDYGYPRAEYYLPSRSSGTLQCYYRHRAHPDVLLWPGLNDITSFVDFTSAAEAAYEAGLDVLGYVNQANFLTNCGLLEMLASVGPTDQGAYLKASRAALRLVAPHEMGELFKVLIVGRGVSGKLVGLMRGDRTHAL